MVNNGTINKNGFTLTAGTTSGSGTMSETSTLINTEADATDATLYSIDGTQAKSDARGLVIRNGVKVMR